MTKAVQALVVVDVRRWHRPERAEPSVSRVAEWALGDQVELLRRAGEVAFS